MTRAYVALGSNLGDREGTLRSALEALAAEPGIDVVAVSRFYDTEPVGYVDQPRFLNGAAALETELPARELLERLLAVELRFGRSREDVPPQGPRTIDLDLLLYGDAEIDEPGPPGAASATARETVRARAPGGSRSGPGGARKRPGAGHPGAATLSPRCPTSTISTSTRQTSSSS